MYIRSIAWVAFALGYYKIFSRVYRGRVGGIICLYILRCLYN
jgi:hypothetical protein